MTNLETLDGRRDASGGYKVDISRGERIGRVSSEWFSRPDDERYLSLSELYASVKGRAERSRTRTVESAAIRVEAHRDDPENLALRPARQPDQRAGGLSAPAPGAACGHQPAIRAHLAPSRADQDAGNRRRAHGTTRRHRPGLWPHLRPRTRSGRAEDRGERNWRYALESARHA
jgi:hypothetical protein